jgi:hypothetical protein
MDEFDEITLGAGKPCHRKPRVPQHTNQPADANQTIKWLQKGIEQQAEKASPIQKRGSPSAVCTVGYGRAQACTFPRHHFPDIIPRCEREFIAAQIAVALRLETILANIDDPMRDSLATRIERHYVPRLQRVKGRRKNPQTIPIPKGAKHAPAPECKSVRIWWNGRNHVLASVKGCASDPDHQSCVTDAGKKIGAHP